MRVRLSAAGLGFMPFSFNLARTKASMGLAIQLVSPGAGIGSFLMGRKAQWRRRSLLQPWAIVLAAARGSGAPILTHATRSAITLSASFLSWGGICRSGSV